MEYLTGFAVDMWATVIQMAPFLLFGFLVAGILAVLIPPAMVERHLGGRGLMPVIRASLFGVPLPLCSCGVIPVAASLRQHGASKGATISFLLSTPETGIDSMFVTWSLLGPMVAIFRPVVAFITGIIGGAAVDTFDHKDAHEKIKADSCTNACCSAKGNKSRIKTALQYSFVGLPRDIGLAMMGGILIAALITIFTPDNFFAPLLGGGIVSMFIMMAIGIPTYVCASASVPIAAALIAKGVSPGAAWVFLMTGPATNAAAIATIWKVLGKRTAIIYLITIAVCAMGSGLVLDKMITGSDIQMATHQHSELLPMWLGHVLGVVLMIVLAFGAVSKYLESRKTKRHTKKEKASCCTSSASGTESKPCSCH